MCRFDRNGGGEICHRRREIFFLLLQNAGVIEFSVLFGWS